jgi:Na+-driven multidrug efflux pump
MARLFAPGVLVVSLAAPLILTVFGDDYAAEGADLLRVGVLGLIPYAINVLFIGTARVQGRGRVILGVHGTLGVMTLVISAALLAPLGIAGVGFAWLIANSAVCIAVIALGLRPLFGVSAAGPRAGIEPLD